MSEITFAKNMNKDVAGSRTTSLIIPQLDEWALIAMKLGEAGIILTTTLLAGNAHYNQSDQDRFAPVIAGVTSIIPIGRVRGLVIADQAGTLYLEHKETAGAGWTTLASVAVSANVTAEIPWTALSNRYFRFHYINEAAAQASFSLIQQVTGL